jgi:hypothetical protein
MISAAEVGVSIIATSAGTMRPLFVWAGVFPVAGGLPTLDEIELSRSISSGVGSKLAESANPMENAV